MAISELQSTSKNGGAVSSTSLAFATAVTSGSLLVAYITQSNGTLATFTVSDNVNGTWGTQDVGDIFLAHSVQGAIFTFPNSGAGSITVSWTSTITAQMRLIIAEWAGILATSPLDQTTANHGGSTAVDSGTTVSTTQASELALGLYCSNSGSPTFTPSSASWNLDLNFASKLQAFSQILTVQGAQNLSGTLSAADSWVCLVSTYKSATAGPAPLVEGMLVQQAPGGMPC